MAFGIQIRTQKGMVDAGGTTASARIIGQIDISTVSGSATVPSGWTQANGFYYIHDLENGGGIQYRKPVFSLSGNTFSWSGGIAPVKLRAYFFVTREPAPSTGYGAWIKNGNGQVILDDRFKPLVIVGRGTSTGTRRASGFAYQHTIACDPNQILLCNFPVGSLVGMPLYSNGYRYIAHSLQNISYIICDPDAAMPAAIWGVRFYKSNGEVLYDSGAELLDVSQVGYKPFSQTVDQPCLAADNYVSVSGAVGVLPSGIVTNLSTLYTHGLQRVSSTVFTRQTVDFETIPIPDSYSPPQNNVLPYLLAQV